MAVGAAPGEAPSKTTGETSMVTMPSRRSAGGRRTTALLAALVTLPALVACSAPSEVVPVAAVSARHAAPADLAVSTEGDALVATWAAPATATSMDVTGYELYVDDAAVVTLDAGTTSHRLAGVRPGDRVYVQVRAVGVDGPGQLAEASTEQVWATPTARPRSAAVEEAQAVAATPTAAPTAAPAPTATSVPTTAAPAPVVTVTAAPEPAPTVTREVVKEVEVSTDAAWAALYRDVEDSVVEVTQVECFTGDVSTGSAFFIGPRLLATVAHVVELSEVLTVEIDGRPVPATVIGIDSNQDLALLRLPDAFPGRELVFAAGPPMVGTAHALVGFAWSGDGITRSMSVGTISAELAGPYTGTGRALSDALQSDVQSEPGSSGGPWLTADGRVVGLDHAGVGETANVSIGVGSLRAAQRFASWAEQPRDIRFC